LECPETTGDSVRIGSRVEIGVHECFRSKRTGLRIVARLKELNIDVIGRVNIVFDSDVGRQVEVGIESASAVAKFDRLHGGELVNVVVTSFGTIETGLDAVAFALDLREGKVDFRDNTSDIEAPNISDATAVAGLKTRADFGKAFTDLNCWQGLKWLSLSGSEEDRNKSEERGKLHFELRLLV
jgi:hypothetical protein